jgi:UDPglucose--hexose-1-phosphate uridylyltransferase
MFKRVLQKPDGRQQILYSRRPIPEGLSPPSPEKEPLPKSGHLRWHPLRREWVAYATHRQHRTFLPPKEYDPLAPMVDPAVPTEMPAGDYDISVFDNLFPALGCHVKPPVEIVPTRPSEGACEVVVFTQNPNTSLGLLPLSQVELLIEVWGDRTRALGERNDIEYVFPFENRGVEVGVTLHHPHGQIYAFPFVPPVAQAELTSQQLHYEQHGRGLLDALISEELRDGRRVLYQGSTAVAFVPVCARYPYEVWVAPRRAAATFADLSPAEISDLARALKTVLLKFDGLWNRPFPYVMVWHQAPSDGKPHPGAHLHAELYPPYRMPGRLKYLAGCELGAGVFAADTLPEDKAVELRAVEVKLE